MINFFLLFVSFHLSRWLKRQIHFGRPFAISIEPTTSCNLRCPECPSGLRQFTRPTGMLQSDLFRKTIDQTRKHLHSIMFYFQGEPYLNPDFLKMVSIASSEGIYTITSTNAHYLNEQNARDTVKSKLDKLIISIDGTTQETYVMYRKGGSLEKVVEGTKEILKQRKALKSQSPFVVWQFVVFRHNEHQISEVRRLAEELGVDEVAIKTAQIYDYQNGNELIPVNEQYSRYKRRANGTYSIKNKLLNQCWRMWQGCVVTWDGKVVPCCFDKDAHHRLGDLSNMDLNEIWRSEEYARFRASILIGRSQIDICRNCTEGTRVWAE